MLNIVIIEGRLTRDPEIRYTQTGKAVAKFAIANNSSFQKDAPPTYVDVVAWDKLGETVNTHLKKGAHVAVQGRLSIRAYDDKDGNHRKATELVASTVRFLGSKPAVNGEAAAAEALSGAQDELAEEVPF